MLEYIENSGGKNYPFTDQGKVLRVAAIDDLNEQARLDDQKPQIIQRVRSLVRELDLPMKLVDVEMLLGGERVIFHYTSEQWVDFRELVRLLAGEYQTRIEMHQVNARDEARIVADYEKCGQQCCCKQFLKVLKPVSMRSAKVQKATLDPTKISGRCGRLMCCLRYEDATYNDLRKRLPHRQKRVETPDGIGTVIDTQILTQLVLVALDSSPQSNAYPLEDIRVLDREEEAKLMAELEAARVKEEEDRKAAWSARPRSGGGGGSGSSSGGRSEPRRQEPPRQPQPPRDAGPAPEPRRPQPGQPLGDKDVEAREGAPLQEGDAQQGEGRKRRRRRRKRGPGDGNQSGSGTDQAQAQGQGQGGSSNAPTDGSTGNPEASGGSDGQGGDGEGGRKRRRRRRRRRGGGGTEGGPAQDGGGGGDGGGDGGGSGGGGEG